LFETTQEYLKLEKIELASLQGGILRSKIYDIYEKYLRMYNEFSDLEYDVLMPEEIRFVNYMDSFMGKVTPLLAVMRHYQLEKVIDSFIMKSGRKVR
jgi:hypothetical protein